MKNIEKKIISVQENGKCLFFERRLNNNSDEFKSDIRLIASNFEKRYKNISIYDIDYKPKDFEKGYFCPVIIEPDGDIVLLETDLEFATYDICRERLEKNDWPGFVVKLISTKFCIFSIDNNTNKNIVEGNLTRIEAKQKAKVLNQQSSLLEYDYEIEEEFLKNMKC